MYFVAMTLQLQPRDSHTRLSVADSVYAHAAILHAISDEDTEAGRALHGMQRNKRITLAVMANDRESPTLRLTFMAQDGLTYANTLMNALSPRSTVRLGKTVCDLGSVDLTNSEWAGVSTWADLTPPMTGRYIHFTFATPTAINKRGDRPGDRFTSLYPEPLDLFSGLVRRWQALEGPVLPDDLEHFVGAGGCVVADYHLHTVGFRTQERKQKGFMGWVVYECRKDDAMHIAALNALARLAFFTGVGYQTARGMGVARATISD
jgi:CRISPR-associated endoribonuclease Cas6